MGRDFVPVCGFKDGIVGAGKLVGKGVPEEESQEKSHKSKKILGINRKMQLVYSG